MNKTLLHQHPGPSSTNVWTGIRLVIAATFVMGLPLEQSSALVAPATSNKVSVGDGSSETSWHRIKPPLRKIAPERSFDSASTYDEARGQVVVFGGANFDNSLSSDTWTWDGTRWTKRTPQNSPLPRYGATMAYDPVLGKSILFGGLDENDGALNDTWAWDGSNWESLAPAKVPPGRGLAAMAYDPVNNGVILFGGITYPSGQYTPFGDTWIFQEGNWRQLRPADAPSPRGQTFLAYVPANAGLLLFGGNLETNDTWLWNGQTWTQLSPMHVPTAGREPALAYDPASSTAVLFLGTGSSSFDPNDSETWTWDGADWTEVGGVSPAGTFGQVFVYDAAEKKIFFFGGANVNTDQWTWNGNAWRQLEPSIPGARAYASMAFDISRDQSVLFGGAGINTLLSDTWTWNGRTWNWVHPTTSPPVRLFASMAYDSSRQLTVLFGGRTCDVSSCEALADTWTFDGANWTRRQSPGLNPPAREGHAMAFDSASGKVVLFGGANLIDSVPKDDTWTWDGINWTLENPPHKPPATIYDTMSRDSAGCPILFTVEGSTWRWNGLTHDWEAVLSPLNPPARQGAGMGYDARSGSIILFGGLDLVTGAGFDDTWAFDGTNWQLLSPVNPLRRYFPAMSDGSIDNSPAFMGGYGFDFENTTNMEAWTWGRPHVQR